MPHLCRPFLAGALAGLLLAGCASRPISKTPTMPPPTPAPSGVTGVAACDLYLASYLACHRAAGLYPVDQLPSRHAAMRSILLRDAADPHIRPQLPARCRSLSNQLQQALHGKSCAEPAPTAASD